MPYDEMHYSIVIAEENKLKTIRKIGFKQIE